VLPDQGGMKIETVPRLEPLPPAFAATVAALHRVAAEVVSPARKPDHEIALIATRGGFGTPVFEDAGALRQVRVQGAELVRRSGDEERREALDVDPAAAAALAGFYAFGAAILEELRANARHADAPSPAWLWPEHFDLAIDLGADDRRATYGFSPGDEHHAEPYAYVGPWTEVAGDLWQASGFRGAELPHAELLAAPDQRAAALEFFTTRKEALG
jgi:hypothetical protein